MKRLEATNTFQEGMVMDFNPLTTPSSVVTKCLNGTLITFNGNEYVLLNDMGNGRVETAYLPEGYVPLGTAELGGIIYIVSYNPLTDKCLIGSFPSPERNITSDENSGLKCELSLMDFKVDSDKGAIVYYLKKNLNEDLTFNPGDKFIVYGNTIRENYDNLYNESCYTTTSLKEAKKHTLKLSLGTITSSGLLVTFDNLKQFNIDKDKKYHIMQYSKELEGSTPNIDDYRSIVEQPFNVFNSKVSGKLVLVAELVQFDLFNVELSHKFSVEGETKTYTPNVTFNFSGPYKFIPKGVRCELNLVLNGKSIKSGTFDFEFYNDEEDILESEYTDFLSYSILVEDFIQQEDIKEYFLKLSSEDKYFDKGERTDGYVLQYKFIPCMNWGQVSYLAVNGQIDLDKLGTGYIGLNSWRYYNENNTCNLTWGLDTYEEEGYCVEDVTIKLTRLVNPETSETLTYKVNKKSSYCGIFYDLLPFKLPYYKLVGGELLPDLLYLAEIVVDYKPTLSEDTQTIESKEPKKFYRWLYTSQVFNDNYVSYTDFKELSLEFTPSLSMNYSTQQKELNSTKIYGILQKETGNLTDIQKSEAKLSKTSLSGILTEKEVDVTCNLVIGLLKSYNMFELKTKQESFNLELYKKDGNIINCSDSSSIKYTEREDSNQDNYLKSESVVVTKDTDYSKYKLKESSKTDVSDILLDTPTNVVQLTTDKINIDSFENNTYKFKLTYKALQLVKAYCTKIDADAIYLGKVIPLAYNASTFENYNLVIEDNKLVPRIIGLYGFGESGGMDGYVSIGKYEEGNTTWLDVRRANNVSLNWTTNPDVANGELLQGWTGPAMFAIHWIGDPSSKLVYWNTIKVFSKAGCNFFLLKSKDRIMLTLRSDKGDQYYYPIDFSTVSSLSGKLANTKTDENYLSFYLDFACILNNLYKYDPEAITISMIIPASIYYMDYCKYLTSLYLLVNSNSCLKDSCTMSLKLEEGSIAITDIISVFKKKGILNEKDLEPLEPLKTNVSYNINSLLDQEFAFSVESFDRTNGIQLRNNMEDLKVINFGLAVMDYDGVSILGSYPGTLNKSKLYVRDGNSVVDARQFDPIRINYTINGSDITVEASSEKLDPTLKKFNINNKFTLDDGGLLILKSPTATEYSFQRYGDNDRGTVDGYQKTYLLKKHVYYAIR